MPELDREKLQAYLAAKLGQEIRVRALRRLGQLDGGEELKGYGYGKPLLVEYERAGSTEQAVLATVSPGSFGHEMMADRAQLQLWSRRAFNELPGHVRAFDVGAFRADGSLFSLDEAEELFLLLEFVRGREYQLDLAQLRDGRPSEPLDQARADALCDYLLQIHAVCGDDRRFHRRHVRELLGHGECIMGLADSYPDDHPVATLERLERIETRCVAWRWRLRRRSHRLRQRHGDFHPWNVLFREGTDFTVLDRSRGEWGDPADDVVCMAMNYLFFSLQAGDRDGGALSALWERFWRRYLDGSGDEELLEVAAPYIAFRGLVMASPLWYPRLDEALRERLFALIEDALEAERFDPFAV